MKQHNSLAGSRYVAAVRSLSEYGARAGDVHTFLVDQLLAAHRAASAITAMSRVAALIPRRKTCSDFRESSLLARSGLRRGE